MYFCKTTLPSVSKTDFLVQAHGFLFIVQGACNATNAAGVMIGTPRHERMTSKSASLEISTLALQPRASARKLSSFASRHALQQPRRPAAVQSLEATTHQSTCWYPSPPVASRSSRLMHQPDNILVGELARSRREGAISPGEVGFKRLNGGCPLAARVLQIAVVRGVAVAGVKLVKDREQTLPAHAAAFDKGS